MAREDTTDAGGELVSETVKYYLLFYGSVMCRYYTTHALFVGLNKSCVLTNNRGGVLQSVLFEYIRLKLKP